MLEALLAKKDAPVVLDELLWLEPVDTAGSTVITDRSAKKVAVTNTGVVVADKGPVAGRKSMYFKSGTYSYLKMAAASLPNLNTGDFTLELWWCPESQVAASEALFGQWRQVTGLGGLLMIANGANRTFHHGGYSEQTATVSVSNGVINTWEHLAFVREGSVFRAYKNGTLVSSLTSTATRGQLAVDWYAGIYENTTAGGLPQSSGSPLNGWMTSLKVYQRAKYKANFTPA